MTTNRKLPNLLHSLILSLTIASCAGANSSKTQVELACKNVNSSSTAIKTKSGEVVKANIIQIESAGLTSKILPQITLTNGISARNINIHSPSYYIYLKSNSSNPREQIFFDSNGSSSSASLALLDAGIHEYAAIFSKGVVRVYPAGTSEVTMKNFNGSENIAIAQNLSDLNITRSGSIGINGSLPLPTNGNFIIAIYIIDQASVLYYYNNYTDKSQPFPEFYKNFSEPNNLKQVLDNGYQFGFYSFINNIDLSSFCGSSGKKLTTSLTFNDNVFSGQQSTGQPEVSNIMMSDLIYQVGYVNNYLDANGNVFRTGNLPILVPSPVNAYIGKNILSINQIGHGDYSSFKFLTYKTSDNKIVWPLQYIKMDQLIPKFIKYDDKEQELAMQNITWDDSETSARSLDKIWNSVGYIDPYWLNTLSTDYCDVVSSVWDIGIKESDINPNFTSSGNSIETLDKMKNGNYLYTNFSSASSINLVSISNVFKDSSKLNLVAGINDLDILSLPLSERYNYFKGVVLTGQVSSIKRKDLNSNIQFQAGSSGNYLFTRKLNCQNAPKSIIANADNAQFSELSDNYKFTINSNSSLGNVVENAKFIVDANAKLLLNQKSAASLLSCDSSLTNQAAKIDITYVTESGSELLTYLRPKVPTNIVFSLPCYLQVDTPYASTLKQITLIR